MNITRYLLIRTIVALGCTIFSGLVWMRPQHLQVWNPPSPHAVQFWELVFHLCSAGAFLGLGAMTLAAWWDDRRKKAN
jgi:hypothetical protein